MFYEDFNRAEDSSNKNNRVKTDNLMGDYELSNLQRNFGFFQDGK
jgi:hypothetical protein